MSALVKVPTTHPRGWVLSQLVDGDMLSTLARAYDVSAEDIVVSNDTRWDSAAIEGDGGWIHKRAGGKRLTRSDGSTLRWVFDRTSRIFLPPGGPRKPVNPTLPVAAKSSGLKVAAVVIGAVVVLVGGVVIVRRVLKRRKR